MIKTTLFCLLFLFLLACGNDPATNKETQFENNSTQSIVEVNEVDGVINGGGGVGIRCNDRLEVLDIYEARRSGLKMVDFLKDKETSVDFVTQRLADHFWNADTIPKEDQIQLLKDVLILPIFEGRSFMNPGTEKMETVDYVKSLEPSKDWGKASIPEGCALEQIAFFSDEDQNLQIVESAWNELDWISKSALVIHELIYLLDRRDGIENLSSDNRRYTSQQTRIFVGRFMSTTPLPSKTNLMPEKHELHVCKIASETNSPSNDQNQDSAQDSNSDDSTYLYAFKNLESEKLSLVFNIIYGETSFYQMRADFSSLDIESITSDSVDRFFESVPIQFSGATKDFGFKVYLKKLTGGQISIQFSFPKEGGEIVFGDDQTLSCNSL